MILAVLLCGTIVIVGIVMRRRPQTIAEDSGYYPTVRKWGLACIIGGLLLLVLWTGLHTFRASFHQVPTGNVGVVYQFGGIVGQRGEGGQWIPPYQTIKDASIQVQTLAFVDDDSKLTEGVVKVGGGLNSYSMETQNVYVDSIIRIQVSPDEIQDLFRYVGPNYVNKLIPGLVAQIFKDETVKYSSVDLAPNRELIRHNVEEKLKVELSRFSIGVDALLVENISFDNSFELKITEKQEAAQEALKQQELVAAEKAKADQKVKEAEGIAQKLRVEADGQAYANNVIAASLTPMLIQFQALQKLADDLEIAIIPSTPGLIIDPAQLLGAGAKPPE